MSIQKNAKYIEILMLRIHLFHPEIMNSGIITNVNYRMKKIADRKEHKQKL